VQGIIQAETPHCPHVLRGERGKQVSDIDHFIRHVILAKDVSLDDSSLFCLDHITDALWKDGVAVIGAAISGEKSDEAL
jgi:hypothetical protein